MIFFYSQKKTEKAEDRTLQTEIPEENEGLLIDMSGGTTKVVMYLDAQIDENNTYTEYSDLLEKELPGLIFTRE